MKVILSFSFFIVSLLIPTVFAMPGDLISVSGEEGVKKCDFNKQIVLTSTSFSLTGDTRKYTNIDSHNEKIKSIINNYVCVER